MAITRSANNTLTADRADKTAIFLFVSDRSLIVTSTTANIQRIIISFPTFLDMFVNEIIVNTLTTKWTVYIVWTTILYMIRKIILKNKFPTRRTTKWTRKDARTNSRSHIFLAFFIIYIYGFRKKNQDRKEKRLYLTSIGHQIYFTCISHASLISIIN